MSWEDLAKTLTAERLILYSILALIFLEITGGFHGFMVDERHAEDPKYFAGILLIVWFCVKYYPPKERRKIQRVHGAKSHVQIAYVEQIKSKMEFEEALKLDCLDDELPHDELKKASKALRLYRGACDQDIIMTIKDGKYWVEP